jgi:hypothetical protein
MEPDPLDAKLPETALRAELEGAREQVAASDDMEQALRDARAQFEAIAEAFDGLVDPEFRAIVRERIRRSYEDHERGDWLEERFLCLDGTPFHVPVATAPVMYRGEPRGACACARLAVSGQAVLGARAAPRGAGDSRPRRSGRRAWGSGTRVHRHEV